METRMLFVVLTVGISGLCFVVTAVLRRHGVKTPFYDLLAATNGNGIILFFGCSLCLAFFLCAVLSGSYRECKRNKIDR